VVISTTQIAIVVTSWGESRTWRRCRAYGSCRATLRAEAASAVECTKKPWRGFVLAWQCGRERRTARKQSCARDTSSHCQRARFLLAIAPQCKGLHATSSAAPPRNISSGSVRPRSMSDVAIVASGWWLCSTDPSAVAVPRNAPGCSVPRRGMSDLATVASGPCVGSVAQIDKPIRSRQGRSRNNAYGEGVVANAANIYLTYGSASFIARVA
jgi:hypothetical protein